MWRQSEQVSEWTQLNSHLGLMRSYLTSISVADNDCNTPLMENSRTHHMSRNLSVIYSYLGKAEGHKPTNRTRC